MKRQNCCVPDWYVEGGGTVEDRRFVDHINRDIFGDIMNLICEFDGQVECLAGNQVTRAEVKLGTIASDPCYVLHHLDVSNCTLNSEIQICYVDIRIALGVNYDYGELSLIKGSCRGGISDGNCDI